jgi:hypothetical protein
MPGALIGYAGHPADQQPPPRNTTGYASLSIPIEKGATSIMTALLR